MTKYKIELDFDGISKKDFMGIVEKILSNAGLKDKITIRIEGYDEELESE